MFDFFFNLFKTDNEIERDRYYKLYSRLNDAIAYHDKKVSEANAAYNSYTSSAPCFSTTYIPSNDFEAKRHELNSKINEII